jgi:predicted PurR-regulated permease PerM
MFGIDKGVARAVWTVAVIASLLYVVYAIRATLLVLIIAVFFSYLIYPLVQLTQRRLGPGVGRDLIISVVFAVVLSIIVLAVTAFSTRVADEAVGLAKELPQLLDSTTLARRIPLPSFLEPFRNRLLDISRDIMHVGGGQALPAAQQIGSGVVHAAINLVYVVVVPILSFLMIRQAPVIRKLLLEWTGRSQGYFWLSIIEDLNFLLSRYVRALLLLSLAALITYSIVLSLLGAPFPLLLAGLAALLEVIPVFGPLVGAIAILAVSAFSGYEHVWWLLAFLVVYRVFQDYVLNPYLMSEGVEVSPVLVVFGLLAGDELAGVAGIFLSVPVLAAAKIVLHRVRSRRETLPAGPEGGGDKP